MERRMGRGKLKMKDLKLKITSSYLSLRVNTRSLKFCFPFPDSSDVSHSFDMTKLEFLIHKAL
jgi:hypothetical protein